jgi:hypothetical protein
MISVIRRCPECGKGRLFQQLHAEQPCPDGAGDRCPEWLCAECGTGLLISFAPPATDPAGLAELRGRVA